MFADTEKKSHNFLLTQFKHKCRKYTINAILTYTHEHAKFPFAQTKNYRKIEKRKRKRKKERKKEKRERKE